MSYKAVTPMVATRTYRPLHCMCGYWDVWHHQWGYTRSAQLLITERTEERELRDDFRLPVDIR